MPHAKSVSRSFATVDSSNNRIYLLMKMPCVMKDTWHIRDFPFHKQKLRLSIENSQYDSYNHSDTEFLACSKTFLNLNFLRTMFYKKPYHLQSNLTNWNSTFHIHYQDINLFHPISPQSAISIRNACILGSGSGERENHILIFSFSPFIIK